MKYIKLTEEEKEYIRLNGGYKSIADIADWIGCSYSAVVYYRRKFHTGTKNVRWTYEMNRELEELWNAGKTTGQIARHFNCSVNSICGRIHVLRKFTNYKFPRRKKTI